MLLLVTVAASVLLYVLARILNLADHSSVPTVHSSTPHSPFVQSLIDSCPILREVYRPPLFWGKSGHVQTVLYAKFGRFSVSLPSGQRTTKLLPDGSTLTFDIYQPTGKCQPVGSHCMLVCPGFGSSSHSACIRSLVSHAQSCGYCVAVLNHLGCAPHLRLTAPRLFSYGGWTELHLMRMEVELLYPDCHLVLVGISMGANIVINYLGQKPEHQRNVRLAISVCQGYSISEASRYLAMWENLRRAYLYVMTGNQLALVQHHSDVLLSDKQLTTHCFDKRRIFRSTSLKDLDREFTCKLLGCGDVDRYYEHSSCCNVISNVTVPLVLLNAEDDPIVPRPLLRHARLHAESHDESVFITTRHGGHIGFFEGGNFCPSPVSWLDRFICQISTAVIAMTPRE